MWKPEKVASYIDLEVGDYFSYKKEVSRWMDDYGRSFVTFEIIHGKKTEHLGSSMEFGRWVTDFERSDGRRCDIAETQECLKLVWQR